MLNLHNRRCSLLFSRCSPVLLKLCHCKRPVWFIITVHADDAKAACQLICFTLITRQDHGNQGIIVITPKLILYNGKYSHNPKLLQEGSVYFNLCLQLIGSDATEHTARIEQMFPLLQLPPNPQVIWNCGLLVIIKRLISVGHQQNRLREEWLMMASIIWETCCDFFIISVLCKILHTWP